MDLQTNRNMCTCGSKTALQNDKTSNKCKLPSNIWLEEMFDSFQLKTNVPQQTVPNCDPPCEGIGTISITNILFDFTL